MKRNVLSAIAFLLFVHLVSCSNSENSNTGIDQKDSSTSTSSSMTPTAYGNHDNAAVNQYTLTNSKGMTVKILNYGGIVTDIMVPDKSGQTGNVVLGYDSLSGYTQTGSPYFGALIGRYGNRIANAKFNLDGKSYTLAANNNGNTLHGGTKGFDKVVWNGEQKDDHTLELTYTSKDGEEGYPGNLQAKVVYTVTGENELKIEYSATTDKPTPINLTNHTYFNLSGGSAPTIENHELMLNAAKYTVVNAKLIPTGALPDVKGTPMDFTTPKKIGQDLAKVEGGYDHNYVLNKTGSSLTQAATAYDSASGRYMVMSTTEPGVQFYSGNFLDGTLKGGRGGAKYIKHAGFCLEAQHFPDSPNQPSFPSTILKPGDTYHQTTVYKFSTK